MSELSAESLLRVCDPASIPYETSQDAPPLEGIIGQDRAVQAIHFGLDIHEKGFNVFVVGVPGTGRTTAMIAFLTEVAQRRPTPLDWCYVNSFHDTYHPRALSLPAGSAKTFQADMQGLVRAARSGLQRLFESEDYARRKDETLRRFQEQAANLTQAVQQRALEKGFTIQNTPMGIVAVPVKGDQPLSEAEFTALSEEQREALMAQQREVQADIEAALRQSRQLDRQANEEMQGQDRQAANRALAPLVEDLKEKYAAEEEVLTYLDEVQQDMLDHLDLFHGEEGAPASAQPSGPAPQAAEFFRRYDVNVLVDNSNLKGAPVITEINPTYYNLFGKIDQEARFGALVTDFTLIRKGALHSANGGYLVLSVEEVLRNALSWDALKKSLQTAQIMTEDVGERMGMLATKTLRPEPIPLDVKVVLIGQPQTYATLLGLDEEFPELFKVKADFDIVMQRDDEHVRDYTIFVANLCRQERLLPFDRGALARLVEHGSRIAEDQQKLSTRFGALADVVREASYYAGIDAATHVGAAHVQKAIDARVERSGLEIEHLQEMIARGEIKIEVEGERSGQINGLSVVDMGDIVFGHPSRITVAVAPGEEGVIDIERSIGLGGPLHHKGVMILAGYLAEVFGRERPLTLEARMVFEQTYSGVEGDSASGAELCALLSALAEVPIKQGIAMTGSVNQKGEMQPVGGVNEKIEGFFDACRIKGLDGHQGVVLPQSNQDALMLRADVVEAVRNGQFHVWGAERIEEALELLTGSQCGERTEDGTFTPGSLYEKVDERLARFAQAVSGAGKGGASSEEEGEESETGSEEA